MTSISLGPFALSLSHVLLLLAFAVAVITGAVVGRKERTPIAGTLSDIVLAALVAARIGFVIRYLEHYQGDLWGIIDVRDGGFDVLTGLAGALAMLSWKLWRHADIRRPLCSAAGTGLLVWGGVTVLINLMISQSSALPDIPLSRLDQQATSLPMLASGQPMVVNLWASWCPPCVREMPVLEQAQKDYPAITFVFVNQGEHPEAIRRFLNQHGLLLDNVLTDLNGSMGRTTGSPAMPTTLFYDAHGRQVDTHLGELSSASLAHSLEHFD